MRAACRSGYTLIEVIVASFVFTTGALGLTAGSAVLARQLGANQLSARAERIAASRVESVHSSCSTASGSEVHGSITSRWSVTKVDSTRVRVAGTVSYITARGPQSKAYAATITCQ